MSRWAALFRPTGRFILVSLCILASACGGSGAGPRWMDGGSNAEAGSTPDGGSNTEAGSAADGGADAGQTVKGDGTPCGDYAAAICNSYSACGPWVIRSAGGPSGCFASLKKLCLQALSYPSTGVDATTLAKCTAATKALAPCGTTPACDFTGSLPVGATCGSDWQCSSGYCDGAGAKFVTTDGGLDGTFSCGKCAAGLTAGAACSVDSAPCPTSSQCLTESSSPTCQPYGGLGEPCHDASCSAWLQCDATGHCARAAGVGADCASHCDLVEDIACNTTTALCEHANTAAVGESCNNSSTAANPVVVFCAAGSTCLPAAGTDQHCVANANVGDACQYAGDGPFCGSGALCSGGVCTAMDSGLVPVSRAAQAARRRGLASSGRFPGRAGFERCAWYASRRCAVVPR